MPLQRLSSSLVKHRGVTLKEYLDDLDTTVGYTLLKPNMTIDDLQVKLSEGGFFFFEEGSYTINKPITISKRTQIVAGKASFTLSGVDYVFMLNGCKDFTLKGGTWGAESYITDRPQVVMTSWGNGYQSFPTRVRIEDLNTIDCGIGNVLINTQDGEIRALFKENRIYGSDDIDAKSAHISKQLLPFFNIEGAASTSLDIGTTRRNKVVFTDNLVNVAVQSKGNMDVGKISGTLHGVKFDGNTVINRNVNGHAEVDFFTGGLKGFTSNNYFKNCAVKHMTLSGAMSPRVGLGGKNMITNNMFEFESNPLNDFAILLRSSMTVVDSNVITYKGADSAVAQRTFNGILFKKSDVNQDGFGSNWCAGNIVSNNVIKLDIPDGLAEDFRVQTINPTDCTGCTFTGNMLYGGKDLVIDARPENMRNVWTGNYIASKHFTAKGIWRMSNAFIGSGNYIGSDINNATAGTKMLNKEIPYRAQGTVLTLSLDFPIKNPGVSDVAAYLLTVYTNGERRNRQTFLVTSGVHDAQSGYECIDSRIDKNTTDAKWGQYVWKLGHDGSGYIKLTANMPHSDTYARPTSIDYMITPISANLF